MSGRLSRMNELARDCVEIQTGPAPTAAVVWLHGLGADGHDFEPIVPELAWPGQPAIRYLFPHAPVRPITINSGMAMRAWYDITGVDLAQRQDAQGIQQSAALVTRLLDGVRESGIPSERTVLAGFSQGGAVALYLALRHPHRLAGVIALSTYLPLAPGTEREAHEANRATPILMGHGSADPVVPMQYGQMSAQALQGLGYDVRWHTWPMPHSVCAEEVVVIRQFLMDCLGGGDGR